MQCLKPGGTAYVATKTMYFGLDGGSLPFRCTLGVHASDVLFLPSSASSTGVDGCCQAAHQLLVSMQEADTAGWGRNSASGGSCHGWRCP
jgi:hypothetical protein